MENKFISGKFVASPSDPVHDHIKGTPIQPCLPHDLQGIKYGPLLVCTFPDSFGWYLSGEWENINGYDQWGTNGSYITLSISEMG